MNRQRLTGVEACASSRRTRTRCAGMVISIILACTVGTATAAAAVVLHKGAPDNEGRALGGGNVPGLFNAQSNGLPPPLEAPLAQPHPVPDSRVLWVKFRDGLIVRLRNEALSDLGTGALAEARPVLEAIGGRWERLHRVDEGLLERLRENAKNTLQRPVADLNLYFHLFLPDAADVKETIDSLKQLNVVEAADKVPQPLPPPLPPSFQSFQEYLQYSTGGISAAPTWTLFGGTGANVRIVDLEYSWNLAHADLPPVTLLGPPPSDPFNNNNHGTAVLGMMTSRNNGWGTTGASHGAQTFVVGVYVSGFWNIAAAIITPVITFEPGDVIVIEQQTAGPLWTGFPPGTQFGTVPVEWYRPAYDAITIAVGNGIVVVEAAANGSQNLDDPIYAVGNNGHWPFLPQNDSGAILVGAGAPPNGPNVDRSRLWYSNFGTTVDLQGWGENIVTTGYGTFYSEGADYSYTATFGGTSGAVPVVASACAIVESVHEARFNSALSPAEIKTMLRTTGSPQQNGQFPASQNIGPRPNLRAALGALGVPGDVTGDGHVNVNDLLAVIAAWGACTIPCPPYCAADVTHSCQVNADDLLLVIGHWAQ